jgi:uncharacterized protein YndB with AHSA1/START domain
MRIMLALVMTCLAAPSAATVKSKTPGSLVIEHRAISPLPPERVFANIGQVARWWNPEHSYSGKAENLSLQLRAGGCFCETLPNNGGVEHMRVSYVDPGKRVLLTGALGPLLYQAVSGVMDIQLKPLGTRTEISLSYKAAGFADANADQLAAPVDRVLGEQIARLAALR